MLKGQIGLATAVFPNKVKGNTLDSFARKFLWDVGLDYGHGTPQNLRLELHSLTVRISV